MDLADPWHAGLIRLAYDRARDFLAMIQPVRGVRRRRNPRRSYDEDGREIAPPTVGERRARGETTAIATCRGCRRHVVITTDRFPGDLPSPDMALRLRCSACGSRNVSVMRDMQAQYASCTAGTGVKNGDEALV